MKPSNQTEFAALIVLILAGIVYYFGRHPELIDRVLGFISRL